MRDVEVVREPIDDPRIGEPRAAGGLALVPSSTGGGRAPISRRRRRSPADWSRSGSAATAWSPSSRSGTGMLACIGGCPVALDPLDRPEALVRLWPRLVRAYALDALGMAEAAAGEQVERSPTGCARPTSRRTTRSAWGPRSC